MKLIILPWDYEWIMDGGIMAEDEYFWTNQDPQPFEPEYAELGGLTELLNMRQLS